MKDAQAAARGAAMNHPLPADMFAGFVALSSDAVIAVDHEFNIVFFNAGAERIFEWTAEEIWGKPLALLLPERFRASHSGHMHGFAAAHGKARTMGERQLISGVRKSGEEFAAEASIQQMVFDNRPVFSATLRDISPRQRAEDALRQAIKARDDMIGIVSHDLRNPANAVKMLAQSIIAEGATLPESVVERLGVVHQAAVQIDTLIQDLLDVTRVEAGQMTVTPRSIDIGEVVRGAIAPLRPLAQSRSIALEVDVETGLPLVNGDPQRVVQVISNLIGNALKFTEEYGRIAISVSRREGMVEVRVADNGVGIPPQQLPHVFDRFYSAAPGARRQGAGLGLPIARGIVEAHGGKIWVDSTVGEGTTVHFTLPVADRRAS
ncbi:MAG: PAS domain-containing sensor histidine kinase [Gemmatimonadota bacterium]